MSGDVFTIDGDRVAVLEAMAAIEGGTAEDVLVRAIDSYLLARASVTTVKIVACLWRADRPMRTNEIAAEIDHNIDSVYSILHRLARKGQLVESTGVEMEGRRQRLWAFRPSKRTPAA